MHRKPARRLRAPALELRIQTTDRYGRSVAELFRGGRNLNQALVASGAAFVDWQSISEIEWRRVPPHDDEKASAVAEA